MLVASLGKPNHQLNVASYVRLLHIKREFSQQGDSDPDMQQRVKAMESVVLALLCQQPRQALAGPWRPSGKVC